ncbi:hypothetical protein EJ913_21995 [Azospirillum doebereinerae]|uniref:ISXO2-like transposase domain-containing protein n=1 Tax=Azospirillum doebereinerae TaxID=92933 RepID=A0A3S0X8W2_9PROT|nr:hypothetical protein EJ913_21995 [Azospirillum doebereinerae]
MGSAFGAHDTVRHSQREYVRGSVHANSAEGFNDRVRRTIAGVFHHITPRPRQPVLWRDRLPLVPAHGGRSGPTPHPQGADGDPNSVVSCSRPPATGRLSLRCRPPTPANQGRRDQHPLGHSCLWLIMVALFI